MAGVAVRLADNRGRAAALDRGAVDVWQVATRGSDINGAIWRAHTGREEKGVRRGAASSEGTKNARMRECAKRKSRMPTDKRVEGHSGGLKGKAGGVVA